MCVSGNGLYVYLIVTVSVIHVNNCMSLMATITLTNYTANLHSAF